MINNDPSARPQIAFLGGPGGALGALGEALGALGEAPGALGEALGALGEALGLWGSRNILGAKSETPLS